MTDRHPVAFLVDVDDTLLDNDRFRDDLQAELVASYGQDVAGWYCTIPERRFVELDYRDYLGAVLDWWEGEGRDAERGHEWARQSSLSKFDACCARKMVKKYHRQLGRDLLERMGVVR